MMNYKPKIGILSLLVLLVGMITPLFSAVRVQAATTRGQQYITSATLQKSDGTIPTDNTYGQYDRLTAQWQFNIPNGTTINAGDTMTVPLPTQFNLAVVRDADNNAPIKDQHGTVIGHETIDAANKQVVVTFTGDATASAVNGGIQGQFDVHGLNWANGVSGPQTINWGVGNQVPATDVTVKTDVPSNNELLNKWPADIQNQNGEEVITWYVRLNFANQFGASTVTGAVYQDILGANQKLVDGSVQAYDATFDTISGAPLTKTVRQATVTPNTSVTKMLNYSDGTSETVTGPGFDVNLGNLNNAVLITYQTITTDQSAQPTYVNYGYLHHSGDNTGSVAIKAQTQAAGVNGSANTNQKTTINGQKTWVDDDDNDAQGLRPASITIDLMQNGTQIATTTATAASDWQYRFASQPVFAEDGSKYTYTVREEPVANYTSTQDGFNFTNTVNPAGNHQ